MSFGKSVAASIRDHGSDGSDRKRYIDGLRGIAIASVFAFHAMPDWVPSGFIGVDVFFVVSGFVIASLILREIEAGTFSLIGFAERRVRRLLPMAVIVYVACALVGYAILLPDAYQSFGKSLASAASLLSNQFFQRQVDYFAPPAQFFPLLHTWSLSIEEQFYLAFPLLFALGLKRGRGLVVAIVCVVVCASLVFAAKAAATDPALAFYAMRARAWELMLGVLIALTIDRVSLRPAAHEALGVLGLVTLAAAFMGKASPFLETLAACAATAMIIVASHRRRSVAERLLSARPVVFTGLISYSLYLWHWPALAFTHIALERRPEGLELLGIVAATIALSMLTWRFVEVPLRSRRTEGRFAPWAVAGSGLAALVMCGLSGQWLIGRDGRPGRLDAAAVRIYQEKASQSSLIKRCNTHASLFVRDAECAIGRPKAATASFDVAVFGDSNADHLVPGLALALDDLGLSGRQLSQNRCLPVFGLIKDNGSAKDNACPLLHRKVVDFVAQNPELKAVVLSAFWPDDKAVLRPHKGSVLDDTDGVSPDEEMPLGLFEDRLSATIAFFTKKGIRVVLVGRLPDMEHGLPIKCAITAARRGAGGEECGVPTGQAMVKIASSSSVLARVAARYPGVEILLPAQTLCNDVQCSAMKNGTFLYFDRNHLNARGSESFAGLMKAALMATGVANRASSIVD